MKRFLKSLLYLVIVLGILFGCVYFTDAFNIFHYRNRRFTSAEPANAGAAEPPSR